MKRNCYLDLRFRPSSASQPHHSMNEPLNMNRKVVAIPNSSRHMLDVTELQARVIIWLASQERVGNTGPSSATSHYLQSQALLMHAPQGFTIKKSLRNFLQKRKKRSQKSHAHCISEYSTT
ncbi:protein JAZ13 [Cajanus cajan]|uniref:protein JAZ13 n=1 Tax=Cajanus cajan TaxID=3821 RepID=UPI00098D822E|nr:protein JAZ13 [Cajanus cajan]